MNYDNSNLPYRRKSPDMSTKSQLDEDEIVARLYAGDYSTIEDIFHAYFDRLYSLVYYSVEKDQDVAEDITQETFVSALKSLKNFNGKSKLYTWLVGIANHKIVDYYRHLERERKRFNRAAYDTSNVTSIDNSSNLDIENTLSGLPLDYRQVLLLKYVDEMPVAEISKIMKKTPKSIEGLLTRARKAFRNQNNNKGKG